MASAYRACDAVALKHCTHAVLLELAWCGSKSAQRWSIIATCCKGACVQCAARLPRVVQLTHMHDPGWQETMALCDVTNVPKASAQYVCKQRDVVGENIDVRKKRDVGEDIWFKVRAWLLATCADCTAVSLRGRRPAARRFCATQPPHACIGTLGGRAAARAALRVAHAQPPRTFFSDRGRGTFHRFRGTFFSDGARYLPPLPRYLFSGWGEVPSTASEVPFFRMWGRSPPLWNVCC